MKLKKVELSEEEQINKDIDEAFGIDNQDVRDRLYDLMENFCDGSRPITKLSNKFLKEFNKKELVYLLIYRIESDVLDLIEEEEVNKMYA